MSAVTGPRRSAGGPPGGSPRPAAVPAGATGALPRLSVVVFCSRNELRPVEVVGELVQWLGGSGLDWELIGAFDGDRGAEARAVRERFAGESRVQVVVLSARSGQLGTIRAGLAVSRAPFVVMVPAWPQVPAASLGAVIEALEQGADYVVGYRADRRTSGFNRIVSGVFNAMVRYASGTSFRDIACGTHGLRRELIPAIPGYGDNQLFLPLLAGREGFRVTEVALRQHPTEPRLRVFSLGTYTARVMSLFTLAFLIRFTQKPLRPFGALGAALFGAGALLTAWLVWQRLFMDRGLADRPMLLLGLLLVTAGIQVVVLGLLGELLIYLHFRDQANYRVRERIGGGS